VKLATRMLAYYIDDVPTFTGLPEDLVMAVCKNLSPIDLCKAEDKLLDNHDTSKLWKRFCDREQWTQDDFNKSCEPFLIHLRGDVGYNMPKPVVPESGSSWKEIYLTRALEYQSFSGIPCKTLQKVNLLDHLPIIAGHIKFLQLRPNVESILDNVAEFKNVTHVEVRDIFNLHQLGTPKAIANKLSDALIQLPKLKSMFVLHDAHDTHFVKPLLTSETCQLRDLVISGNPTDRLKGLKEACKGNKSLCRLSVTHAAMRSRDFAELIGSLSHNITFLDCSDNNIVGCNLSEFCELERLRLNTLVLNSNPLGVKANVLYPEQAPSGVDELLKRLPSTITELSLSDCRLADVGHVTALANKCIALPNLKCLNVSRNTITGHDKMPEMVRIMSNCHNLEWLVLSQNEIDFEDVVMLSNATWSSSNLVYLNFDGNRLGDRGAEKLAWTCLACPKLQQISILGNNFTTETLEMLQTILAPKVSINASFALLTRNRFWHMYRN